jgi:hypothetical protein
MVKISSPARKKSLGVKIKKLLGFEVSKNDLFDSNRLLLLDLEKGDAVALIDRKDNVLELSRNRRGHFDVRELRNSEPNDKK